VIVAREYIYLSSLAFLTGGQLDALVRERVEGDASGEPDARQRRDAAPRAARRESAQRAA